MSEADTLANELAAAGLPPDAAYLSPPPTADAPPPPEGRWAVVPAGAEYAIGAMGRGRFATYALAATIEDAAALVVRLLTTPPTSDPAPEGVDAAGAETARGIKERTAARGGAAGPAALGAGDLLDLTGPDTGHHLYALGTPMPERSAPPTEWGDEYHRYRVLRPLTGAQEGTAAPWFEQPGGGAMVVTEHPVRWYVDKGYLVELV